MLPGSGAGKGKDCREKRSSQPRLLSMRKEEGGTLAGHLQEPFLILTFMGFAETTNLSLGDSNLAENEINTLPLVASIWAHGAHGTNKMESQG